VLGTHALFDPTDDATLALLRSVGSDPLYNRLCKQQNSFRARLTPKPWRCGHTALSVRWPRETDKQQRRFERWQAAYDARQTQYATCRFLGVLGSGVVHPQIQPIIELHDRTTRSHEPLPLA
jgi:hypothetical protein